MEERGVFSSPKSSVYVQTASRFDDIPMLADDDFPGIVTEGFSPFAEVKYILNEIVSGGVSGVISFVRAYPFPFEIGTLIIVLGFVLALSIPTYKTVRDHFYVESLKIQYANTIHSAEAGVKGLKAIGLRDWMMLNVHEPGPASKYHHNADKLTPKLRVDPAIQVAVQFNPVCAGKLTCVYVHVWTRHCGSGHVKSMVQFGLKNSAPLNLEYLEPDNTMPCST